MKIEITQEEKKEISERKTVKTLNVFTRNYDYIKSLPKPHTKSLPDRQEVTIISSLVRTGLAKIEKNEIRKTELSENYIKLINRIVSEVEKQIDIEVAKLKEEDLYEL